MSSGEVLRVLGTMKALNLNCRPSEMIGIVDSYTAFCFDEACALIITKLEQGEQPVFKNTQECVTTYSRPSEVYSKFKHGEV